jgi:hypothetical protein
MDEARTIAASLTPEERAEVLGTLHEVIREGTGWFATWCRNGLTVLEQVDVPAAPAAPQATPGEARFCISCGTERTPGGKFCISCGAAF